MRTYKGVDYDVSKLQKAYTLNDIPESMLNNFSDVMPRGVNEPSLSYRQRIVDSLNFARLKELSRLASRTHNVNKMELRETNYDSAWGNKQFIPHKAETPQEAYLRSVAGPNKGVQFGGPREFVTLDIETDDHNNPISISALKHVFNTQTGRLETVDKYQRFYSAKDSDLKTTYSTHGLTHRKLQKLRSQLGRTEGIHVPKHYNSIEEQSFKNFLGSSVLVGHNIVDFDLHQLFRSGPIKNQTIDTLTAARNMWPNMKNDLDSVFQRLFHKTMGQAGLPHHISSSDVIANAMIFQELMKMKGDTPNAIRYVARHGGTHLGPSEVLNKKTAQVYRGYYNQYKLMEKYMDNNDYYGGDSIEDIMGAQSRYEGTYNEDTGAVEPPYGSHIEDINDAWARGTEFESEARAMRFAGLSNKTLAGFTSALERVNQTMAGYNASTYQSLERLLASMSMERASKYLDKRSITGAARKALEDRVAILREQKSALQNRKAVESWLPTEQYIRRLTQRGDLTEDQARELYRDIGTDNFTPASFRQYIGEFVDERKRRLKETARLREEEGIYQWSEIKGFARDLDEQGVGFSRDEALRKIALVDRAKRKGAITEKQADVLNISGATQSFDELSNSLDGVINKNQKLHSALQAISQIPMYNFERLEKVFKGEVSGIKSAAQGVVPGMVWSPLSRLTDAAMNSMNSTYANLKFGVRAGTAIGGGLMAAGSALLAGGVTAPAGLALMGIGGLTSIGSQIYGNYKEAGITKWGEGIQNTLNTLGFLKEMVLMPFRLLATAVRTLIKSLNLLTSAFRTLWGIMGSGLSNLTQMGNPLTGLTGVGYGAYMGSISADYASLLGRGTINNLFNDAAAQRAALYTTGQLDTNRLVAASMLGLFNETYGYGMDEESALRAQVNSLAKRQISMSETDKRTMYMLANKINPNMGAILQSMDTLGITDYNELKRPRGMWGYSDARYNSFRSGWQTAQWEYQYAGTQLETSRNRIGASLWNKAGRGLYNGFNEFLGAVADALDSNDWSNVGSTIKNVWETIKAGASSVWDAVKQTFGMKGDLKFGDWLKNGLLDIGIGAIKAFREVILPAMNTLWDSLINLFIDKMTGLVEYLGTIQIDFKELKKMLLGQEHGAWITSISDVTTKSLMGKYSTYSDYPSLSELSPYERGYVPAYDKVYDIAVAFDKKYGKGKGITGENVRHFDPLKGEDVWTYITPMYSFSTWLRDRAATSSPEELVALSGMLSEVVGHPISLTTDNAAEFMDFLSKSTRSSKAATWMFGGKFGSPTDISEHTLSNSLKDIFNTGRTVSENVFDDVLGGVQATLESKKAEIAITVDGKPVATLEERNGALTATSGNNRNVDVAQLGNALYKFTLNAVTRLTN